MSERQLKRMKMQPPEPPSSQAVLSHYPFSPSNVFSRMMEGHDSPMVLFVVQHTFALFMPQSSNRHRAVLVIKHPASTLIDLNATPEALGAIMGDLQALARAMHDATKCAGVKIVQCNGPIAGQTVPQLHFNIHACYSESDEVKAEEVEPLEVVARIRNLLPPSYDPPPSSLKPSKDQQAQSYGPCFYAWAPDSDAMERLGASLQLAMGSRPGTVILLNGSLGAGKSTISRGFVRAACKDAQLEVPSPTFLLCLSYKDDLGHDPEARRRQEEAEGMDEAMEVDESSSLTVHHMDPYRLGTKADKMAGLIDFTSAFRKDACLIEWPDRMPSEVMKLPMQGVSCHVSGVGIQSVGRLVRIEPLNQDSTFYAEVLRQWRDQGMAPDPTGIKWREDGSSSRLYIGPNATDAGGVNGGAGGVNGGSMKAIPSDRSKWIILGIESSCDDTAAAVLTGDGKVLSHRIASQAGLHEIYGGVKPDVARDAHARTIQGTVDGCLEEAGVKAEDLTAVAATIGPGLSLCLQVGVQHGLMISALHRLPFIPVHHMEAHALMTRLPSLNPDPTEFPALILLVSGGHNMLVLSEGVGRHRIIGTTLDDSVGECFDKIARLIGIAAIPGGPHLEKLADEGEAMMHRGMDEAVAEALRVAREASSAPLTDHELDMIAKKARTVYQKSISSRFDITLPMQTGAHKDSCNFSFSGIKTSVSKLIETERVRLGLNPQIAHAGILISNAPKEDEGMDPSVAAELHHSMCLIAASFQRVAVKFLQQRTRRALQWIAEDAAQMEGEEGRADKQAGPPVCCLVVAGGVAANKSIRSGLESIAKDFQGMRCVCPPVAHCTDNGLMVAWTGVERLALGLFRPPPALDEGEGGEVKVDVDVLPRWPIGPVDPRSASSGMKHIKAFK